MKLIKKKTELFLLFLVTTGSFSFSILFAEFTLRLLKGSLTKTENLLFASHNFQPNRLVAGYPERIDANIGWVPKENITALDRTSKSPVHTLDYGLRSTGIPIKTGNKRIMAIGDSFTWGDQVGDDETWPAYLQQKTKTTVFNAGVSGYGLDQSILRAEALAPLLRPTHIVFEFIAHDIIRCGWGKAWGLPKPYFLIKDNDLVLHNVPVPSLILNTQPKLGFTRDWLGRSYLANAILFRIAPSWWLADLGYTFLEVGQQQDEVACHLIKRLKRLSHKTGIKILLVAQYEENLSPQEIDRTKKLLVCATARGITTLDLLPLMTAMRNKGKETYSRFISWHHTATGNELIAENIANKLFD